VPISGQITSTTPSKVQDFIVNPAGTRLVGIGHFTSVTGKSMSQAFKLNLGTSGATMDPWHSARFNGHCNPKLGMWVRAIDVAPDGNSFYSIYSVNATGAAVYIGGHGAEELWSSSTGLWVGSDGAMFNGEFREAIAFCPL
jgi:hypothetical protein